MEVKPTEPIPLLNPKNFKPGDIIGYTRPKSFLMLRWMIDNNIPYIYFDTEGSLRRYDANQ